METFEKEIEYESTTIDVDNKLVKIKARKIAMFKELNQTDRTQHKLHWQIVQAIQESVSEDIEPGEKQKVLLNTDAVYDLTRKAIRTLFVPNPECSQKENEQFLEEFLCDSGAMFEFGFWLLAEKFAPFFSTFSRVSQR